MVAIKKSIGLEVFFESWEFLIRDLGFIVEKNYTRLRMEVLMLKVFIFLQ